MNDETKEQVFLRRARALLDASSESLDPATRARLRAGRAAALAPQAGLPARWTWWPAGGLALASVAILSWTLWLHPAVNHLPAGLEQLELLTSADNLELYSDLDFYQWLGDTTDAS
jgi:hypothetical protein